MTQLVEHVVVRQTHGTHEHMRVDLAGLVHTNVEQVVLIRLKLQPGTPVGDDAGVVSAPAILVHFILEIDTGHKGELGETYLVGGKNEYQNIDLVHLIAEMIDDKLNRHKGTTAELIEFVEDRPGHDVRYAIDASKIESELGFSSSQNFEEKLKETIDWYLTNPQWIKDVVSGEYRRFYELNYGNT